MSLYTIIDQTKPYPSIKVNSVTANSFTAGSLDATTLTLSGTTDATPGINAGTLNVPNGGINVGKNIVTDQSIYAGIGQNINVDSLNARSNSFITVNSGSKFGIANTDNSTGIYGVGVGSFATLGGASIAKDLHVQGKLFASNYSGPTGQSLLTGISYVVGPTAFPTAPYYSYIESNGIVTLTIMGYSGILIPTTGYIELNLASTIPSPDMAYELTTSIAVGNVAQPTRAILLPGGLLVMYYIYSDQFINISGTINFNGMTFTYKKA
jgi:hypothetical protein